MKQYTEENLIFPIQNLLLRSDGFLTTTQIIRILKRELNLSKADNVIVRDNTTRFERTVHNSVSHRTFHTDESNDKKIVNISPTGSRINVMRLTTYGRKMVRRKNQNIILGR